MNSSFRKYFSHYAEKEVSLLDYLPAHFCDFDLSLTVPLCSELETLPKLLESSLEAQRFSKKKILHIFVVNHRQSSSQEIKENNRKLLEMWKKRLLQNKGFIERKNVFLGTYDELSFLFVDRASEGVEFDEKSGVGLARKIACDLASKLYVTGRVKSSHVFTTDGDAQLPPNFYELPPLPENYVLLSSFAHDKDMSNQEQREAISKYETYLQSYVDGLCYAGSPYAFHTIGSCIGFSAGCYMSVRGFPKKRLAGEDFYFLGKASKGNPVIHHISDPIRLSSRLSERVPFGTGQSIGKILEEKEGAFEPYSLSDFELLKSYLDCVKTFILSSSTQTTPLQLPHPLQGESIYHSLLEKAKEMSQDPQTRLKHFHNAFDSFQTLKFIHRFSKNKQ